MPLTTIKVQQYTIQLYQAGTNPFTINELKNTIGPPTTIQNDGQSLYLKFPQIPYNITNIHLEGATNANDSAVSRIITLANSGQPNIIAKILIQLYNESGYLGLDIECLKNDGTADYLSNRIGANRLHIPTLNIFN